MSMTFTKLFSSITESTVWCESAGTRLTWITMLAMSDRMGRVFASIPGLANRARVTREECEQALDRFLAPDPYSRTYDHEGRRIEKIDGGWRLLNHAKYRNMQDVETRREQNRVAKQNQRQRDRLMPGVVSILVGQQAASALEDSDASNKRGYAEHDREPPNFEQFWERYPLKRGKREAQRIWDSCNLDELAPMLIDDVESRLRFDAFWQKGFIPNPSKYLRDELWTDDVQPAPHGPAQPPPASEVLAQSRATTIASPEAVSAARREISEMLSAQLHASKTSKAGGA